MANVDFGCVFCLPKKLKRDLTFSNHIQSTIVGETKVLCGLVVILFDDPIRNLHTFSALFGIIQICSTVKAIGTLSTTFGLLGYLTCDV